MSDSLEFTEPPHLTADFDGEPGHRTFYLQVGDPPTHLSLLLEKGQVQALADAFGELLGRLDAAPDREWDRETMRLRVPIEPAWRIGTLSVGVDPDDRRFLLEVSELLDEDDAREPSTVRIWASEEQARRLAAHAAWTVRQGRPSCPLCGLPMDPEGHACPATNGHRRRD